MICYAPALKCKVPTHQGSGLWTLTPTNCTYVKMCKKYRESCYSQSCGTISNRNFKVFFMGTECFPQLWGN